MICAKNWVISAFWTREVLLLAVNISSPKKVYFLPCELGKTHGFPTFKKKAKRPSPHLTHLTTCVEISFDLDASKSMPQLIHEYTFVGSFDHLCSCTQIHDNICIQESSWVIPEASFLQILFEGFFENILRCQWLSHHVKLYGLIVFQIDQPWLLWEEADWYFLPMGSMGLSYI